MPCCIGTSPARATSRSCCDRRVPDAQLMDVAQAYRQPSRPTPGRRPRTGRRLGEHLLRPPQEVRSTRRVRILRISWIPSRSRDVYGAATDQNPAAFRVSDPITCQLQQNPSLGERRLENPEALLQGTEARESRILPRHSLPTARRPSSMAAGSVRLWKHDPFGLSWRGTRRSFGPPSRNGDSRISKPSFRERRHANP